MVRPGGLGPIDPIYDVATQYGGLSVPGTMANTDVWHEVVHHLDGALTSTLTLPRYVTSSGCAVIFEVIVLAEVAGSADVVVEVDGNPYTLVAGATESLNSTFILTYAGYDDIVIEVTDFGAGDVEDLTVIARWRETYCQGEPVSVTINQSTVQEDPGYGATVLFDVSFSTPVTGFVTGDPILSGTAGATTATVINSGDDMNFIVAASGMTGVGGTVIATIPALVCTSIATGVGNDASTSSDNIVTWNGDSLIESTINASAGITSSTLDISSVADGKLVVWVSAGISTNTTIPAGWTSIANFNVGANTRIRCMYRVKQAGDGVFTLTTGNVECGNGLVFPAAYTVCVPGTTQIGSASVVNIPDAVGSALQHHFYFAGAHANSGSSTAAVTAGYTERFSRTQNITRQIWVYDKDINGTDGPTVTLTGDPGELGGVSFSIGQ